MFLPTDGRTTEVHHARQGTHATKWPLHAQWARPAGQEAPKLNSCYAETPGYSSSSPAYPSTVPSPQPATEDSAPCAESTSAANLPSESATLPYAYRTAEYRLPETHAYPLAC